MKISGWLLTGLASWAGLGLTLGEPMTSSALIEKMLSEKAEVVAEGERLLAADQDRLLDELLKDVASGHETKAGKAAAELGILLSPWLRGKEAGARFIEWTRIPSPRRPVERVPRHPRAAAMREALQTGLGKLLNLKATPTTNSYHVGMSIKALCETLGEVADDTTMPWVLARLEEQRSSADRAEPLAGVVSSYLGIPPAFRHLGICGNSTEEEFARFRQEQAEEVGRAHRELAASWAKVEKMTPDDRIRFAIAAWRNHFVPLQQRSSGHFDHEALTRLFEVMESLVRLGTPAVDLLRAQQKAETELEAKGVWEVIIATITGKEDPALMKELFAGRDPHWELAVEVVAASGSKAWMQELDGLQKKGGFDGQPAGIAIAISGGVDAVPLLKHDPDTNQYLILELEGRRDGKLRPGLGRYPFP